ncbi:MAG: phosphodiester glycosidase family protein [Patescibacteria group bacterium]
MRFKILFFVILLLPIFLYLVNGVSGKSFVLDASQERLKEEESDMLKSQVIQIPGDAPVIDSTSQEQTELEKTSNVPSVAGVAVKEGYSYQYVNTEKGKFGVFLIKMPLSKVRVKTVAANKDDCKGNCPVKPLLQYVKENNAYAAMNGSYFCPPDYATCKSKINSYDYAFYNSNKTKWMNKKALTWNKTGLATFSGTSAKFYKDSSTYKNSSVTAGLSNYPMLLKDGNIVVNLNDLTSVQKNVKGLRGAIGSDGSNVYLAQITRATVLDAAYAMRALGVKHALNLDGGGSAAMYIDGGYKVGPGRLLPNAIVLVK